jgi:O-antigen/teichoic acid export membrane protein
MSTHPSLFRSLKHYLSGRVLLLLLGFLTFPLMTRMLTAGEYGLISLSLRVILFLTVLSKCGLQYSAARFYDSSQIEKSIESKRRFYSTLVLGPVLTSLAVCAIYTPILLSLQPPRLEVQLYRCLLVAPALVLLRTLQTILLSFLRNEGHSLLHSVLEIATRVLTVGALVALLLGGLRNAFSILVATAISEAVIVSIQLGMLLRRDLVRPSALDWSLIRTSLAFGAPLIAYELSSIVLDSGDRLLVRHFLGDTSLGYYSAAYNVSNYLQESLMSPLNLAIVPVYMRLWNEKGAAATQAFLSKGLSWLITSIFFVTAATALTSRDLFVILASQKYDVASHLLPVLIPSLMLYATHIFLNVGLILEKRTVLMASLVGVSAAVNLGLNLFMIPSYGLIGAAWANLISYGALISLLAVANQRILPLALNTKIIWQGAIASVVAYFTGNLAHFHSPWLTVATRLSLFVSIATVIFLALSFEVRAQLFEFLGSYRSSRQVQDRHIPSTLARQTLTATEAGEMP